nr:Fpg/Nei family DNA glycosylase [Kineosporia babensis]
MPEVEVVRRGLARWMIGTTIDQVEVLHPRPVRRHEAGIDDFVARLNGVTVTDVVRRGKFLWLTLDSGEALMAHLGMSGQLLLEAPDAPDEKHLRVRLGLQGGTGRELRFVDQRMFGGLAVVEMIKTTDGGPGGLGGVPDDAEIPPGRPEPARGEGPVEGEYSAEEALIPVPVAHIARDALDPALDVDLLAARLKRRETGLKRALLDQTLISGIGNIYADEALWRARLHYERPTHKLNRPTLNRILADAQNVMREALAQGGTSFDSLYVDVNGQSGYFERGLDAYGREGEACHRCGTQIRRETFMNRSSFFCPKCQPKPRGS